MMMKQLTFLTVITILLVGCKTNPPTSPDITPTGNVTLNLRVDNSLNSLTAGKVVLIEDFANVSCNPCVTSNIIIEKLTNDTYGRNRLVAIKFPTNFPAPNDLFYLAAKEICDSRISYYNVFFAPTTVVDGVLKPISTDSSSVKTAIDTRISVSPRFELEVNASLEGDYAINIDVKFVDTTGINMNDLLIHTVITETDIEFEQAPGSNGETKFFDVTRLMLPTREGGSVRQLIDQDEISFQFNDALLSSWNLENLNTVVFIQDKNTKEIFQAGSTFE
jgi:hypothetical protein